jgi:hypothetical protein
MLADKVDSSLRRVTSIPVAVLLWESRDAAKAKEVRI